MVISTTMAVRMVDNQGRTSEQAVRWEYRPTDPYTLQLHIVPGEQCCVWTLSREGLWDAIRRGLGKGLIGDGDVKFDVTTARVHLYLYGSDGAWARLAIDRDALWVYLRSTLAVVPEGEEHKHYDLDAEIAKLLPRGDGCDTRADAGEETGEPMA